MGRVLIIEDSEDIRLVLEDIIKHEGYEVFGADSGRQAMEIVAKELIDLVFLDIGLPDTDGVALISRIKEVDQDIDIIMLTGMNDAKTAVNCLKAGAIDYILKPFELIELKHVLNRSMKSRLYSRQAMLAKHDNSIHGIIGQSRPLLTLKDDILTAASVKAPVLITGETGSGKELVARAIHNSPKDSNSIFVKVDCGTLSATIIESELFGYEKGAFTDARRDKKGLVEMADGGTLFLDEIGNLPIDLQPLLLRLIEESTFRRVGGLRDIRVKVRIIAATNVNIDNEVAAGRFREDLYYRLNVIPISVPSLRDRGSDILALAHHFLGCFGRELKKEIRGFTPDAEKILLQHDWPGNIRELKNLIERAVIYTKGDWIDTSRLEQIKPLSRESAPTVFQTLAESEKIHILRVLASVGDNKSEAARILNISRNTLRDKLR